MNSKYIAAIEIGSSRIKGIVAAVDEAASIRVLAVEEVDAGESVRHGRVQNAREVGDRVNEIIRRIENNPRVAPAKISAVFLANGGRSLSSAPAKATVNQGGDAEITPLTLERLHKDARYNLATDREVLAISPRRYVVDHTEVKKIIGAFGNVVHGEFTILTCSPENRRALDRVHIESQGRELPRTYITRLMAQTAMALSDSDRQLGAAFIDFGAETTTLAVFRDGALQYAATLPMGGANITRDLCMGMSMTAEKAENLKRTKGRAVAERVNLDVSDPDTREIIGFVSARSGEIIANINNLLASAGFKAADLPAGIVITGGAARMAGFAAMLEAQTKMKVRYAAVDGSIAVENPADNFDVISLVKYSADNFDISCLESIPEEQRQPAPSPAYQPRAAETQAARTRIPDEDDPNLLKDDPDDYEQARNIIDDPDDMDSDIDVLPEPGKDSVTTRKRLLKKLKDIFRAPVDDNLDD